MGERERGGSGGGGERREWGSGGGGEGEKRRAQGRVGEENPQKCSSYVILTASKNESLLVGTTSRMETQLGSYVSNTGLGN